MPQNKQPRGKRGPELECSLEIPKFLQGYKDMLGENSVFAKQLRKERDSGYDEIDEQAFPNLKENEDEKKEDKTESTQPTKTEVSKKDRIMSNKTNALVHELSKKLVANQAPTPSKTAQATVPKKAVRNKRVTPSMVPDPKRKKGMLTFELDSDSDHLLCVCKKTANCVDSFRLRNPSDDCLFSSSFSSISSIITSSFSLFFSSLSSSSTFTTFGSISCLSSSDITTPHFLLLFAHFSSRGFAISSILRGSMFSNCD